MATTFQVDTKAETIEKLQTIITKEVTQINSQLKYTLLNYDTQMVCNDDPIRGLYNGATLDPETRKLLALGPTKSYSLTKFKTLYGNAINNINVINVSEMIEGLFFQLFYDDRLHSWEIGTRNSVGANYSYYRMPHIVSPTYKYMIFEALGINFDQTINEWLGIQYMDKSYVYHFVMQHPNNHMVLNIEKPSVYMVGAFELHFNNVENQIRYVPPKEYKTVFPENIMQYPTLFTIAPGTTYETIMEQYNSIQTPASRMGIIIQNVQSGDTVVTINPAYEELQVLRGTHPNLMFQYVCLLRIGKTHEFLRNFPQYKSQFAQFKDLYETLVRNLHQSYLDHFILKKGLTISKRYYYHIQQIHHNIYIPSLQEGEKVIIKKPIVRKYIESMEPGQVFHLLGGGGT